MKATRTLLLWECSSQVGKRETSRRWTVIFFPAVRNSSRPTTCTASQAWGCAVCQHWQQTSQIYECRCVPVVISATDTNISVPLVFILFVIGLSWIICVCNICILFEYYLLFVHYLTIIYHFCSICASIINFVLSGYYLCSIGLLCVHYLPIIICVLSEHCISFMYPLCITSVTNQLK